MFGEHYRIDENYLGSSFKIGEWECSIVRAEAKVSQSGNEMVVLELDIPSQGQIKYWLVDDKTSNEAWERTNRTMTRFFDCFGIQRGNFNINSWIGARGKIYIDKGAPNEKGHQYFEVKSLIVDKNPSSSGFYQGSNQEQFQQRKTAYTPPSKDVQRQNTWGQSYQPPNTGKNIQRPSGYEELDNIPF